jgi:hypothetical protein
MLELLLGVKGYAERSKRPPGRRVTARGVGVKKDISLSEIAGEGEKLLILSIKLVFD